MEILNLLYNLDSLINSCIVDHGNLVYLLLFTIAFLQIAIFPLFFLPGNPLIFIAGSFCSLGSLDLTFTMLALGSAVISGNLISYQVGKLFGYRINNSNSRWANKDGLNKTRKFYEKYGQYTLLVSPFIAMIRTFAPLLAGVTEMQYKKYLLSSTIGGVFWVVSLVLAGYYFSGFSFIQEHMASIILAGLGVGFCFVAYGLLRPRRKRKAI